MKNQKHKTPLHVLEWQKAIPKNCHTCCHYSMDGTCSQGDNQSPPEDFAASDDACGKWYPWEDVPF